jgi:putative membrane protein
MRWTWQLLKAKTVVVVPSAGKRDSDKRSRAERTLPRGGTPFTLETSMIRIPSMKNPAAGLWQAMAVAVFATAVGAAAYAQSARVNGDDEAFLKQAAENGHTEVEGSQLALKKATNGKVKAFAQKMVDDHTKANQELVALASAKGVKVPAEPSMMQKGKLKLLGTADGASFDEKYADQIGVQAHEETVALFQKAADGAKDADVKAWATKTLPKLKMHLDMARTLKSEVGGKS